MNYQLARTNTYLGGQMKLDLLLNRCGDGLCIEDFHMSPVSNHTGFAWGADSELLNSRHAENIRDYYAKTKNFFYEDCIDPALDTKYPIYSPNYPMDTHDNDAIMGLYRLDRKTYDKSYGFFCPFWITDPKKFLNTRFVFKVFKYNDLIPSAENSSSSKVLVSRIALNMHDISDKAFHNKFVKYFNEYLEGFASHEYDVIGNTFKTTNVSSDAYKIDFPDLEQEVKQKETAIEKTKASPFLSDDLLHISLKDQSAWLKGINPETGTYTNKDISYICSTLLERERPLMDTDFYLARLFKDNTIIAQQLINFNFIFDLADIVPANVYEQMQYSRIGIEVHMYQEEDVMQGTSTRTVMSRLPLKDFYSNYEDIPKAHINTLLDNYQSIDYVKKTDEDPTNVLEYKQNDRFIDYTYKNKLMQNTIHWSVGDSEYIFNLYDGFSPVISNSVPGIIIGGGSTLLYSKARQTSGNMPFTPNIAIKEYDVAQQNFLWAKYYNNSNILPIGQVLIENYKDYYTNFSISNEWISGVKYDFSTVTDKDITINANMYQLNNDEDDDNINKIKDVITETGLWVLLLETAAENPTISIMHSPDQSILMQINGKHENLTFAKIRSALDGFILNTQSTIDQKIVCFCLKYFMNKAISQNAITLGKTYFPKHAKSPAGQSLEVNFNTPDYNFVKGTQNVLYRYDGKLLPRLIDCGRSGDVGEEDETTEENIVNFSNYVVQYEKDPLSVS